MDEPARRRFDAVRCGVESLHLVFGRGPFSDGCRGGRPWLRRRSHALCARSAELRSVRAPATTRATPEATNLAVYNRLRIGATSAALAVMDDSGLPRAETRVRSGFWTGGMDSAAGSAVIRAIGPARTTCPRADATARARWSEASCFGRSSWAVAVPGAVTCHNPPIVASSDHLASDVPVCAGRVLEAWPRPPGVGSRRHRSPRGRRHLAARHLFSPRSIGASSDHLASDVPVCAGRVLEAWPRPAQAVPAAAVLVPGTQPTRLACSKKK